MNYQQACQILGVSPGTDFRDIKKKYRKLMSALHPDVHISARSRYHYNVQEINIAYALLKEASLKDSGATCLSGGHQPGGTKKASGAAVDSVSGAIIMGTMSEQNKTELKIGKDLCRILAVLKGWHYRSKLVDKMVNGPFCKKFKPARTRADWVTSDTEKLDQYVSDPLCSFVFTVNAYYQMFCGIQQTQKRESIYMIPKTLPIFMVSGSDDPVGGFWRKTKR